MLGSFEIFETVLENSNLLAEPSTRQAFISESEEKLSIEYIKCLNDNTRNEAPGNKNWERVYEIAHQIILLDVECLNTEKRSGPKNKLLENAIKFLKQVVDLSLPLLKTARLVKNVCKVLQNVKYKRIRSTYVTTILQPLIENEVHIENIKLSEWQSLLEKCLDAYQEEGIDYYKVELIYAVQSIVKYGCLYKKLNADVVKQLPFLTKLLNKFGDFQNNMREAFLHLTLTVCQSLMLDNRMELCKFGEIILPHLIGTSYLKNKDGDIYDLFFILVRAHHPRAAHTYQDATQTFDETKWKRILNEMQAKLFEECKHQGPDTLIKLACEVFTITSNGFEQLDNPDFIPTAMNNLQMFSSLSIELASQQDSYLMISVLIGILEKYPACLRRADFLPILKNVTKMLQLPYNSSSFSYYVQLAIILMHLETKLFTNARCKQVAVFWDQIWDEWPKLFIEINKMPGQQKLEYYELLHKFILYSNLYDPSKFCTLYQAEIIKWSPLNVSALLLFCQHFPLGTIQQLTTSKQTEMFTINWELTSWSLFIPWAELDDSFPLRDLSELLICLTLQHFCQRPSSDPSLLEKMLKVDEIEADKDVEKMFISFLTVYKTEEIDEVKCMNDQRHRILFDRKNLKQLDNLILNISKIIAGKDELKNRIFKTALAVRITSDIIDLDAIKKNRLLELTRNIQASLKMISAEITNYTLKNQVLKQFEKVSTGIEFYAKALQLLFEAASSTSVAVYVLNHVSDEMIDSIRHLLSLEMKSESDQVCAKSAISLMESAFCCMQTENDLTPTQSSVMKDILSADRYDLDKDFTVIQRICEYLTEKGKHLKSTIFSGLIFLCKNLYKFKFKNIDIVDWLLKFLPKLFAHVKFTEENKLDILQLIFMIHEKIEENQYGLRTHFKFAKMLCKIVKLEPTMLVLFRHRLQTEAMLSSEDMVLEHFKCPHFCIRMQMADLLPAVFECGEISHKWKVAFFDKIKSVVTYLLNVSNKLNSIERIPWIVSASNIITKPIVYASVFANEAAFILLSLQVEKNVSQQNIIKILNATSKEKSCHLMIENELKYFIAEWLAKFNKQKPADCIKHFPYSVLHCSSETDFFKQYMKDIFSVIVTSSSLESSVEFCQSLNVTFPQALKSCFIDILPWLIMHRTVNQAAMQIFANALGAEVNNSLRKDLMANVSRIVIIITEKLHDAEDFEAVFGIKMHAMKKDKFQLNVGEWKNCLVQLLKTVYRVDQKLDEFFILKVPTELVKIFTGLTKKIYSPTESYIEDRLKCLYQYVSFSYLISTDITQPKFDNLSPYTIQTTCFNLINMFEFEDLIVAECANRYLDVFLRLTESGKTQIIREIFPHLINSLTRLALRQTKNTDALSTLRYLIINQEQQFHEQISKLVSFPRDEKFWELQAMRDRCRGVTTLENELLMFLENTSSVFYRDSIENIRHLKDQVKKKRKELCFMQETKIRSNEISFVETSLIEQVVTRIIQMLKSFTSSEFQLCCIECLGTIGPVKFATRGVYTTDCVTSSSGFLSLIYNMLMHLSQCLVSTNSELRESINSALYSICSSIWSKYIFKDNLLKSLEDNSDLLHYKLPKDYLYPFWKMEDAQPVNTILNIVKLKQVFSPENHIWTDDQRNKHTIWIMNLTCEVATCVNHFEEMSDVFRSDVHFCKKVFPELIHSLINSNKTLLLPICLGINKFLKHHFGEGTTSNCHPQVLELILNCIDLIKLNVPPAEKFPLDLLAVSRAAMNVSCHIRGLYYAEMAYNEFLIDHWTGRTYKLRELNLVDNENGTKLQVLVKKHCIEIADIDMIHGCRLMFDDGAKSLKNYYADLRKWDKLIHLQDVNLEHNVETLKDTIYDLQQNGLDWMAQSIASQWNETTIDYQLVWQLTNWSKLDQYQVRKVESKSTFEMNHLNALRYFSLNSQEEMKICLNESRNLICKDIYEQSIDNSKAIYAKLSHLQMCREMEELMEARQSDQNYETVITDWKLFDTTKGCDFEHLRYILLQRRLLFNILDTEKHPDLKNEIYNTYIFLSKIAREQGFFNIAVQELDIAAMNCDVPRQQNYIMQFEQALAVAARSETELAVQKFRNLTLQQDIDPNLKAKALIAFGDKVTELRSQNPLNTSAIYSEAYEILKSQESYDSMMKTQITIAKYKDSLYQDLLDYISSPEYISFKKNVESTKPEVKMKNIKDNDMRKTVHILSKQYEDDYSAIKSRENNLNEYMLSALNNYLDVLERTDSYDAYIARVIAIWLKHKNYSEINNLMEQRLPSIPSYKFVSLMRQISPTLRQDRNLFSQNIRNLIKRMALDHPYHCIPILLMLKNYQLDSVHFEDDDSLKIATRSKVVAAEELIRELKETDIKQIIEETDIIANALIDVAYASVPKGAQQQQVRKGNAILKIINFHKAAVITTTVQVRKDNDYSQAIVGVQRYLPSFKLVGGINQPKVLTCIGTDGKKREELVKGKDDMRQDAIMQQLFRKVNNILTSNPETQEKKLYLRTYNIVPLTQRSGVVEWCQYSKSMIAILLGPDNKSGVHKKYFPNDESSLNCKMQMRKVSKSSIEEKLRVYNECCKSIHPAFQYFFLENFLSPQLWFERRLTYTKSVAASSIVGYIVGLGDRHFNNILLDERTCEVIHIDFGIAFEQGSVLSVPETVPFRMTRDMEAGMGPIAVDGVLKRSCEVTLEALRTKHNIIIMLLRVLLYDPLFQWLITEEPTIENPDTSFSSWKTINEYNASNQSAQRAIARVQQRLQGLYNGTVLTVPMQVTKLIQESRDPTNLCQLYDGWQPFL